MQRRLNRGDFLLLLQVCDCQTIDEIESDFCKDLGEELARRQDDHFEEKFAVFKREKPQLFLKK